MTGPFQLPSSPLVRQLCGPDQPPSRPSGHWLFLLLPHLFHYYILTDSHSLGLRALEYLQDLLAYSSRESCASLIASTSPPLLVRWLSNTLSFTPGPYQVSCPARIPGFAPSNQRSCHPLGAGHRLHFFLPQLDGVVLQAPIHPSHLVLVFSMIQF